VLIRNKLLKFHNSIYLFKFNIQAIHIRLKKNLLDIEIVKTECKLQNKKKFQ